MYPLLSRFTSSTSFMPVGEQPNFLALCLVVHSAQCDRTRPERGQPEQTSVLLSVSYITVIMSS
jgi:hypothetical protein